MANQEHLDILKQGVDAWNKWRKEYPEIWPALRESDLSKANLKKVDLSRAHLFRTNFSEADLRGANLQLAYPLRAKLKGADLTEAILDSANFIGADLRGANLRGANLRFANLTGADLSETNLHGALLGWTVFGNVDLRSVKGLETVIHASPSQIDMLTLSRSQGNIPERFLKEAGASDTRIDFLYSLVNNPIEYYYCFISYSSKDQDFAERLHADLQNKGVRCWFAPHDLKTGDRYRDRIDESIRLYDKLLLILSKNAVASTWVEEEVEKAMDKERQL